MVRKRPHIPLPTRYELWARAAGRCQFRGCNELLYRDGLTKKQSNLAKISHIIAFSPEGPRGHPTLSKKLEKAISNLMLTCHRHAKTIDDKDKEGDYPVELLDTYKKEHEHRVRQVTGVQDEARAHVLLVSVPINTRPPEVLQDDAYRALLPLFPAEETARVIDLSGVRSTLDDELLEVLQVQLEAEFSRKRIEEIEGALAVFALAPIPLLVDLGCLLGDLGRVYLFQRHRAPSENWIWPTEEDVDGDYYEVVFAEGVPSTQVAVLLSVSSEVSRDLVAEVLPGTPVFSLQASSPGKDFLQSEARVKAFALQVRVLLNELRIRHPDLMAIHLFAAIPAPVAIEFGRHLHGMDAPVIVYEFNESDRRYDAALRIQRHREPT